MPTATGYQRRVDRYNADRAAFIAELGGHCVDCGTTKRLEFDHTQPRDWEPSSVGRWTRLELYKFDHAEGRTIELRCRSCNARKGKPRPVRTGTCGFCGGDVPEGGTCGCA